MLTFTGLRWKWFKEVTSDRDKTPFHAHDLRYADTKTPVKEHHKSPPKVGVQAGMFPNREASTPGTIPGTTPS